MDLLEFAENTETTHNRQVANISALLAKKAGFSQDIIDKLTRASALHDLGKVAIPPEILNKPSSLTPDEFEIVKTHTELGYQRIADAIETLELAGILALEHHEKWNGQNGYIGLSGDCIHPLARIVCVADVFDALFSVRPYKSGWSIEDICEYFKVNSGTQFESAVVDILLSSIEEILEFYSPSHSADGEENAF